MAEEGEMMSGMTSVQLRNHSPSPHPCPHPPATEPNPTSYRPAHPLWNLVRERKRANGRRPIEVGVVGLCVSVFCLVLLLFGREEGGGHVCVSVSGCDCL